jgi:amidase
MHFAASGAEALDRLSGEIRPALIAVLSDINMPGMDGLELLGEIKQRHPDLPVMIVTTYGDDERRHRWGFRVHYEAGRFRSVDDAIVRTGATVDDAARPGIAEEEHHRLFMLLLRAATASRMRDEDFARQQEIAATLSDGDFSDRAAVARGATLLHRAWGNANEARTTLRYTWHAFFKRFDVLLTPVAATAAFPHNRNPNRDERTVSVNGKAVPYAEQLFFAGLASLSYLPATAAPIGLTGEGLPVGLQITGPEGEDSTTIEFARLLAAEIGGFVPPPAYA